MGNGENMKMGNGKNIQKLKKITSDLIAYALITVILISILFGIQYLLHGPAKYRFIHIPKTGGTAFNAWLDHQQQLNLCKEIRTTHTHILNTLSAQTQGFRPITIIRHPIDRFISSFYYWKKGSVDIEKWKRSTDWETGNEINTPDDLISILSDAQHPLHEKINHAIAHKDQYTEIWHFLPQSVWITNNTNPIIICYDSKNLASNIQKTFDDLKIKCPTHNMPVINKSQTPKKRPQLSQESIQWIHHIYKEDFALWEKHCQSDH